MENGFSYKFFNNFSPFPVIFLSRAITLPTLNDVCVEYKQPHLRQTILVSSMRSALNRKTHSHSLQLRTAPHFISSLLNTSPQPQPVHAVEEEHLISFSIQVDPPSAVALLKQLVAADRSVRPCCAPTRAYFVRITLFCPPCVKNYFYKVCVPPANDK